MTIPNPRRSVKTIRKRMPRDDRRGGPAGAAILRDGLPVTRTGERDHFAPLTAPLAGDPPLWRFLGAVAGGRGARLLRRRPVGAPPERLEDLGHPVLHDTVDPRERLDDALELLVGRGLPIQQIDVALEE